MAQDATYTTKTYHEREGDRYVAGSGGTFAVESGGSMLMADSTTINIIAGGALSIEEDAVLGLVGEDINLTDMRHLLASEWGTAVDLVTGTATATESLLADSNVPANVRIANIIAAVSMSSGSLHVGTCSAGREVLIRCIGDKTGTFTADNTSVCLQASGCIMLNSVGGAITEIHLETSTDHDTWVILKAVYDDVWAVAGSSLDITTT